MPHLGKCVIYVLSLYVLGMVIMQHCGQTRIASFLSGLLGRSFGTMRQRLREFTYESEQKRGRNRQELDVKASFAPLLKWVIGKFSDDQREVVLVLDATYLKDRFIILAVSVVVAGSAIPVAWHIRKWDCKGKWNPIWIDLLQRLQPAIPPEWKVFVLTDQGLYSKKLFEFIHQDLQWIVFMRIGWSQGLCQFLGSSTWHPIREFVSQGMKPRVVQGHCFKGNPLPCTLILQWETDYKQPCVLVSNLAPQRVQHNVYGIRYWIECGFKDVKRGFLHWEQTKITCPKRAERLWLVMSIALFWLLASGVASQDLPRWQSLHQARPQQRILSAPLLGWIDLMLSLLKGEPLAYGYLHPYPWLPIPDP